jgi:hypothetical protein
VKRSTSLLERVFPILINISIKVLFFVTVAIIEITTMGAGVSAIIGIIFPIASVLATVVVGVTYKHKLFPHLCILFFDSGRCADPPITSRRSE